MANWLRDKKTGRFIKIYLEPNRCIDCGKEITRKATRCKSCANRHYNKLGLRGMKGKKHKEETKIKIRNALTIKDWAKCKPYLKEGYLYVSYKNKDYPLHDLIYCKYYGLERIPSGHVVHHINGIKTDNRIENLRLMKRDEHTRLHNKLKIKLNPEMRYFGINASRRS